MARVAVVCAVMCVVCVTACGGTTTVDAGTDGAHAVDALPFDFAVPDAPGCADADGDGHPAISCGGDDCDDHDANRYPGHVEICDAAGHDDDCNLATLGPDADGDGFPATGCCNTQLDGTLRCGGDCDDTRNFVNPTAPEVCDGIDDNCDGAVDEGIVSSTFYPDCDRDGFGGTGTSGTPSTGCSMPTAPPPSCPGGGWSAFDTDCNDSSASVHIGAIEVCNGMDDDCNGMIDEGVGTTYFADCDSDTYGNDMVQMLFCDPPTVAPASCVGFATAHWVTRAGDCDDAHAMARPLGGPETCDGLDNDCDGTTDNAAVTNAWCNDPLRALPHATSACTGGSCTFSSCAASYTDCSAAVPGCEANTQTDTNNCGTCGHVCRHAGCAAGVCSNDYVEVQGSMQYEGSCARRASGAVDCWGYMFGSTPTAIAGISDATQLAMYENAGQPVYVSCAVRRTGAVSCWGTDMLAGGFASTSAVDVGALTDARYVAVTGGYTTDSARVWVLHGNRLDVYSWEAGSFVMVLSGYGTGYGTAVEVDPYTAQDACARFSDGTVQCYLRSGGLPPMPVSGLADAVSIGCDPGSPTGTAACHAVRTTGQLVQWNVGPTRPAAAATPYGTVSDGVMLMHSDRMLLHSSGLVSRPDGTAMSILTMPATTIGGYGYFAGFPYHACAILRSGPMVCWGGNANGELGNGTTIDATTTPVTVVGS